MGNYNYPLLNKVFETYSAISDLSDTWLVSCQHLLEPQFEMFKRLINFGFKPANIILLGKAYSANMDVAVELRQLGIDVRTPEFLGKSFDIEHRENCLDLYKSFPTDITKVVILDDGGELIKIFSENNRHISFAVEQTSSGFRKLEGINFNFPVINVARSAVKLLQESPLVARLCFERMQKYFQDKELDKPKILVVGLGPIGEAVLEIFKQDGLIVDGFDIKYGHSDLISRIREFSPDVVVGATGANIISKKDLETLVSEQTIHFISVSSSDREFEVAPFRSNNNIHDDVYYKNFVFINNGFPITFKGNRYELTPIEIEKTVCLLGGSVAYGIAEDISTMKGMVDVPQELQDLLYKG